MINNPNEEQLKKIRQWSAGPHGLPFVELLVEEYKSIVHTMDNAEQRGRVKQILEILDVLGYNIIIKAEKHL